MVNVVTGPTTEPISLDEAKLFLRVDTDADDSLIVSLIAVAREIIEKQSWHALLTQTLEYVLNSFPGAPLLLPRPPFQSLTSITYRIEDGTVMTVDPSVYAIADKSYPAFVTLATNQDWPSDALYAVDPIRINYIAGWTSADVIPSILKHAILLQLAVLYENRGSNLSVPDGIRLLCNSYRLKAKVYG